MASRRCGPSAGFAGIRSIGVDFAAAHAYAKSEDGRKFIMAGALGECGSSGMCGLSLRRALPLPRLQAWRLALLEVNAAAFAALQASAVAALERLTPEELGKNGRQFLDVVFP